MGKLLHIIKTNKNIPIYAAAVMLCLTLISTYFVAGLYARYATSGESSDSARVAKFSITGDGDLFQQQTITKDFVPGESYNATLNIHNNSEVAVEYTVAVNNVTGNLPLQFSMEKIENNSAEIEADAGGTTFTAQRLPGGYVDQYELVIEWEAAKPEDKDPALMGKVDYITVTVTAAQID